MSNKRGPKPSAFTINLLCSKAAGRCQFEGCNEFLLKDNITSKEFNSSNIAHIVASSPDGPRGDAERSHILSDKIENLMLLCQKHHTLIDKDETTYTEEVLIKMKEKHEKSIFEHCSTIYNEPSEIVRFLSPIKGFQKSSISITQAQEALVQEKKIASLYGQTIDISSDADYHSHDFWKELSLKLDSEFNKTISAVLSLNPQAHFSIFPLAPIPLIVKLGFMMGDKINATVYQKYRFPDTWLWQSKAITNSFITKKEMFNKGSKIALVISLSSEISKERVRDVYAADIIYSISAERTSVDCIQSPEDLSAFWHIYQKICDEIRNENPETDEIAVFLAVPVSAAFEIGRRYMGGVYPTFKIFDNENGFFETISVGG